jgi:hypothetical protein
MSRYPKSVDRDEIIQALRASLKRDTVRPLDRQDAEALRQQFKLDED